jgi:hypothetical protein
MSRIRITLGNGSLVGYPQAGGLWTLFLQYTLGLVALGHEVLWLEVFRSTGDAARDQKLIDAFFGRVHDYGLDDHYAVLLHAKDEKPPTLENGTVFGKSSTEVKEWARTSDLLWNFASALRQPLLSLFNHRALIDIDPGHFQVSALAWDMGQHDHQMFLTVGVKIGDSDCEVPTLGLRWHTFPPFVYLPMWHVSPDPGPQAPFTSITQWNWGEIWLENRVLSIAKRDAYLRYLDLPKRTGRTFQLAANIHPDDETGDRELLQSRCWNLVDPHDVAASPALYQQYISRSRAEISCPKPIFRELKTGWFSDRSACYLASGRPVLAEDTGFRDRFPTGDGLVVFRDLEEAVAGVANIDANYARHSQAARAFAEEFLDSGRCLKAMLTACGL